MVLLVSIDQHCPTACLHNVVFMPACFTSVLYKVRLSRVGVVGVARFPSLQAPGEHDPGFLGFPNA